MRRAASATSLPLVWRVHYKHAYAGECLTIVQKIRHQYLFRRVLFKDA